jgi:hypothetical protein
MSNIRHKLVLFGSLGALALGSVGATAAQARHGADDPAGHNASDDKGGLVVKTDRKRIDDRPGDDHGSR